MKIFVCVVGVGGAAILEAISHGYAGVIVDFPDWKTVNYFL